MRLTIAAQTRRPVETVYIRGVVGSLVIYLIAGAAACRGDAAFVGAAVAGVEASLGTLIPQLWVYTNQLEGGQPYRAVVSLLGHHFSTFASPHVRAVFLRAIAWAGKRDADSLATPDEIAALK